MKLLKESWPIARKEYKCDNWCDKRCFEVPDDLCDDYWEDCHEREICKSDDGKIHKGERYHYAVYRPLQWEREDYDIYGAVMTFRMCINCYPEKCEEVDE